MPNLPNRAKHESGMSLAVASVFHQHAPAWPRLAWGEFQDDLEEAMKPHLAKVYTASREHSGEQLELDDPGVEDHADKWASKYAPALAKQISDTTRDRAKDAEPDYDPAPLFSEERAARIGTTETTRAITAGQVGIVAVLLLLRPGYEGPWWETEHPDPCEVCDALDGEPRRVWSREFPEGPPGPHPECCCALSWFQ